MATTFLNAYTRLMGLINRPVSETTVLAEAKAAINDAIDQLQRNHAYHYSERLFNFTYPAATQQVNLQNICGGVLRDIHTIQIIANESAYGGPILEYMSYNQIQMKRRKYQREHPVWNANEEWDYVTNENGHEEYTSRQNRYLFFRLGENIGLYPVPTEDVQLLINAHIWFIPLVDDDDESFFLTFAYDVVMTLALKRMNVYMKEDNRFGMTEQEIASTLQTLIAWDGQVAEGPLTQLT